MSKNTKKMGRPSKMPPADKVTELYSYFTAQQIAKVYDVSESTVRSWVCRIRKGAEKV